MADATVPYLNTSEQAAASTGRPQPQVPEELISHPKYRILEMLGAGGMGVVYKAEHRRMERIVALKVINRALTAKAKAVERFHLEVKAAAKLTHPNIVTAHDADQEGDVHFLVMEFVEGVSLARFVERKGPLPPTQACFFVRQVALGLQHAHDKGMVHRDIKPHNLMITRKGVVKILDFGLARFATESSFNDTPDALPTPGSLAGSLTAASTVIGTPDFLAPEQARNSHQVDIRADIYSLGCTLYYLLTGRPPFPEGSALEKLLAHWEREPAPIGGLDPHVNAVLKKMMAKKPEARYQTPAELAAALLPLARATAAVGDSKTVSTAHAIPPLAVPTQGPADTPTELEVADVALIIAEPPPKKRKRPRVTAKKPWWQGHRVLIGSALVLGLCYLGLLGAIRNRGDAAAGTVNNADVGKPVVAPRVLIVVPQKFWMPDYTPLRQTLEEGGAHVTIASTCEAPCQGMSLPGPKRRQSETVKPDLVIEKVQARDYDAIVFIGHDVNDLIKDGSQGKCLKQLLYDMEREGRVIGGLCVGQKVLASNGLLRGKNVAVPQEMGKWAGLTAAPTSVAVDGNLVTGRSPDDAHDFALALLKLLAQKREPTGTKSPAR